MLLAAAGTAFAAKPEFPGGRAALDTYIRENLKYPATSLANGVEGAVNVSFNVNPDGTVGSIKIVRMVDPDLEQEAIRLVKGMPAWNPGTDASGNPTTSAAEVQIVFELPE